MKLLILLFVAMLVPGCASNGGWWRFKKSDYSPPVEKQTARQSVGRPIHRAGQSLGRAGTIVCMTAGINPICIPLVVPAIAIWIVALPVYYGGIAISGDEADSGPFDP